MIYYFILKKYIALSYRNKACNVIGHVFFLVICLSVRMWFWYKRFWYDLTFYRFIGYFESKLWYIKLSHLSKGDYNWMWMNILSILLPKPKIPISIECMCKLNDYHTKKKQALHDITGQLHIPYTIYHIPYTIYHIPYTNVFPKWS